MKKISKETRDFLFDPEGLNPDDAGSSGRAYGENEFVKEFGDLEWFLDVHFNPLAEPDLDEEVITIGEEIAIDKEKKALLKTLSSIESGGVDEIESGTLIADRFEVKKFLDSGGFGMVYQGYDRNLQIDVAIKILKREKIFSPKARKRFFREAKVLTGIKHPNVVRIYDVGEFGEDVYLVMEFVDGVTLESFFKEKEDLRPVELKELMIKISDALGAIHDQDIIHRDIKPANIMVTTEGNPVIMDFGLAKEQDSKVNESEALTLKGNVLGTPQYMAPEQFTAPEKVCKASDIYSLGITFYELSTGELPIKGKTFGEYCNNHQTVTPKPIQSVSKSYSAEFGDLISKMLEKEPSKRFYDAGGLREAIQNVEFCKTQRGSGHSSCEPSGLQEDGPVSRGPISILTKVAATLFIGFVAAMIISMLRIDPQLNIRTTNLTSGGPVLCEATSKGGFIHIEGNSEGISKSNLELLLFLNRKSEPESGWYLQHPPNGVKLNLADGAWKGTALVGNPYHLPIADEMISLALLAVKKKEAEEIKNTFAKGKPWENLPGEKQAKFSTIWNNLVIKVNEDSLFQYPQPRIFCIIPFGKDYNRNSFFSNKIASRLEKEEYTLTEREKIAEAINEFNFIDQKRIDQNSAVKMGKWLGANFIITGSISQYEDQEHVHLRAFNVEIAEVLGTVTLDPKNPNPGIEELMKSVNHRLIYRSVILDIEKDEIQLKHGKLYGAEAGMKVKVLDHEEDAIGILQITKLDRKGVFAKPLLSTEKMGIGFRVEEIKEDK